MIHGDKEATKTLIHRARRLDRFLTQPYHGTEHWLGVPGETVALADALEGCRQILDGQHDELPEDSFYHVGTIDQAVEKAKSME
jgi:F-type H+-transporting ATPase subunit beta